LEAGSVLPNLNFPQLDFVKPSRGFHPVTWERVTYAGIFNFKVEPIRFVPLYFVAMPHYMVIVIEVPLTTTLAHTIASMG